MDPPVRLPPSPCPDVMTIWILIAALLLMLLGIVLIPLGLPGL